MLTRSFSVFRVHAGGATSYDVLGPLPEGVLIARLQVTFHLVGAGNLNVAAVVGPGLAGTAEGMAAGRTLLTQSGSRVLGAPTIGFLFASEMFDTFWLPVGLELLTGSQHVVVASNLSVAGGVVFTVEVEEAKPVVRAEMVPPVPS